MAPPRQSRPFLQVRPVAQRAVPSSNPAQRRPGLCEGGRPERRQSGPSAAPRDMKGRRTKDLAARFPGETGDRFSRRSRLNLQATRYISTAEWRKESKGSVFLPAGPPSVSTTRFLNAMQKAVRINRLGHHDYCPPAGAGPSGSPSVSTISCVVIPARLPVVPAHPSSTVPAHSPDARSLTRCHA